MIRRLGGGADDNCDDCHDDDAEDDDADDCDDDAGDDYADDDDAEDFRLMKTVIDDNCDDCDDCDDDDAGGFRRTQSPLLWSRPALLIHH